jgi:hypothetical protein
MDRGGEGRAGRYRRARGRILGKARDAPACRKGPRFGQALLKPVPSLGGGPSLPQHLRAIVEDGFRPSGRRFGASSSAIAAAQHDWRGFRIATCSRERDAATLPKIWTHFACRESREQEPWRLR